MTRYWQKNQIVAQSSMLIVTHLIRLQSFLVIPSTKSWLKKTRALFERQGRSRDVYDVINIARTYKEHVNPFKARDCLQKKFRFKSLPEPTVQLLMEAIDLSLLKVSWEEQLSHQLPLLLPVETFYNDLPAELAWWIMEDSNVQTLQAIKSANFEELLPKAYFPELEELGVGMRRLGIGRKASIHSSNLQSAGHLYQIRYAARNRLCIILQYNGISRLVEPYSLRRPQTGNLLFYAYELTRANQLSEQIKAFKVTSIGHVEITRQSFAPKFLVEL